MDAKTAAAREAVANLLPAFARLVIEILTLHGAVGKVRDEGTRIQWEEAGIKNAWNISVWLEYPFPNLNKGWMGGGDNLLLGISFGNVCDCFLEEDGEWNVSLDPLKNELETPELMRVLSDAFNRGETLKANPRNQCMAQVCAFIPKFLAWRKTQPAIEKT